MELALLITGLLFLYFVLACELRKPIQELREICRDFDKDFHDLCPFPKGEKTYLDELHENVSKKIYTN